MEMRLRDGQNLLSQCVGSTSASLNQPKSISPNLAMNYMLGTSGTFSTSLMNEVFNGNGKVGIIPLNNT